MSTVFEDGKFRIWIWFFWFEKEMFYKFWTTRIVRMQKTCDWGPSCRTQPTQSRTASLAAAPNDQESFGGVRQVFLTLLIWGGGVCIGTASIPPTLSADIRIHLPTRFIAKQLRNQLAQVRSTIITCTVVPLGLKGKTDSAKYKTGVFKTHILKTANPQLH